MNPFTLGLISAFGCASALAAPLSPEQLPANLVCQGALAVAPTFEIVALNSEDRETSIPDSSSMDFEMDWELTRYSVSNECDNYYGMVFFTEDLLALARGQVAQVTGLMNYYNSEMYADDGREFAAITIPFTCEVSK